MQYIQIDKDSIPYTFEIDIDGTEFGMAIRYNERFDFFTVDLTKDGETVILGEKMIYGQLLFASYPDESKIPGLPIIPYDEAGKETRVGWDQLENTVFLFVGGAE